MNVMGKVVSVILQVVYFVATPFHPFGGAVDIIVVQQQDGSFRSTPWYVRFGNFLGVLKGAEKVVRMEVNGIESNFHMYIDNSGEAYFVREIVLEKNGELNGGLQNSDSIEGTKEGVRDYQTDTDTSEKDDSLSRLESYATELSECGFSGYENLDMDHVTESENLNSEVVLVTILSSERNAEEVELNTPQFHLGPGEGTEKFNDDNSCAAYYLSGFDSPIDRVNYSEVSKTNDTHVECQLEVNQGDGGRIGQEVEIQDMGKQITELHASSHNENPPQEILEVAQESQDKSPLRSISIDETQDVQFSISAISDEASSPSSGIPSTAPLPDSQAQAETIENNALDTGASASDSMIDDFNHDTKGQLEKEVDAMPSQPTPASEEEIVANNDVEPQTTTSLEGNESETRRGLEISLCRNLLHSGMGSTAAAEAFDRHRISEEVFKSSAASIIKNENLVIRIQGKYLPWDKAAPVVLGMVAYGLEVSVDSNDAISVEQEDAKDQSEISSTPSGRGWRLPMPFRGVKTREHTSSNSSNEDVFADSESGSQNRPVDSTPTPRGGKEPPHKQLLRTNVPTSDQIASLKLKEGQNMVTFISFSRVLGPQKVEARIFLLKWNERIVISDVDGTITKSDVLGQFMPLVGKDWTHSGIARLFSEIKENGYQLLFLSARAIVQAYLTRTFLFNLKQDGKTLPNGPVVISPDGLFPSLYREVIRRAPHEFKIACLEDIKSLFPPDYNPFYAGFGNRDTDELSYRKIGIPKGKIFIINPKGEVAINNRIDVKSYTSLHTLVHDMFPPTSLVEQEDFNSWNYWKVPLPDLDSS